MDSLSRLLPETLPPLNQERVTFGYDVYILNFFKTSLLGNFAAQWSHVSSLTPSELNFVWIDIEMLDSTHNI